MLETIKKTVSNFCNVILSFFKGIYNKKEIHVMLDRLMALGTFVALLILFLLIVYTEYYLCLKLHQNHSGLPPDLFVRDIFGFHRLRECDQSPFCEFVLSVFTTASEIAIARNLYFRFIKEREGYFVDPDGVFRLHENHVRTFMMISIAITLLL